MRRGCLAQALQRHAWDPSPLSKPNLCRPRLAAPSFLVVSYHRRRDYNNHNSSDRFSASIASLSTPTSTVSDFAAASRGRALNFDGCDFGRRLTSGSSRLSSWNWNWRRTVQIYSRGLIWGSTRSCLDTCRRLAGPQQGSTRRAKLATMAASPAKGGGAPEGYRPNVGLCLVNEMDEVFVASRLDIPDSWQMPQGGVDEGEEPRNAAIRELREETGVTTVQFIGEVPDWLTYDFPLDVKTKITGLWGKEWTGQAQKWFLFRFTGDDTQINLAGDGSEKPEFGDWKWLPAKEVLQMAVEFKKPVYAQAFKSLSMYIDSWSEL